MGVGRTGGESEAARCFSGVEMIRAHAYNDDTHNTEHEKNHLLPKRGRVTYPVNMCQHWASTYQPHVYRDISLVVHIY